LTDPRHKGRVDRPTPQRPRGNGFAQARAPVSLLPQSLLKSKCDASKGDRIPHTANIQQMDPVRATRGVSAHGQCHTRRALFGVHTKLLFTTRPDSFVLFSLKFPKVIRSAMDQSDKFVLERAPKIIITVFYAVLPKISSNSDTIVCVPIHVQHKIGDTK
jgi:hypothetical protein